MRAGHDHILVRHAFETGALFFAECPYDFGWTTEHQRSGWYLHAFGHQCARTDDRLRADHCAIENGRMHPNQALIADRALFSYNIGDSDSDEFPPKILEKFQLSNEQITEYCEQIMEKNEMINAMVDNIVEGIK